MNKNLKLDRKKMKNADITNRKKAVEFSIKL